MVFEQDCKEYPASDFFIIKLDLSTISHNAAWINYQPTNAVYYGQRDGTETPLVITVDEYGFIVVAGNSNSPTFGVVAGGTSMLYLKTHWDLNYELNVGPTNVGENTGTTAEVPVVDYIKNRFITPKFYTNQEYVGGGGSQQTDTNLDPTNDAVLNMNTDTNLIFMVDMFYAACGVANTIIDCGYLTPQGIELTTQSKYFWYVPYEINEVTFDIVGAYIYYTYNALPLWYGVTQTNYGYGQQLQSQPYTYFLRKGEDFQENLPFLCMDNTNYGLIYNYRQYEYTVGTGDYALTGLSVVNSTGTNTRTNTPYIYATVAANGITNDEGFYYMDDYEIGIKSLNNFCATTETNKYPYMRCYNSDYHDWSDNMQYVSRRRWNFGVRPKVVVDDFDKDPPHVI
mmetsp:Transcript_34012/g.33167  ORF Transcript_34012/g.33167 Transcript_34012/m.33167 type:complete len:398 (-) Transcript_34012:2283-3476(-)